MYMYIQCMYSLLASPSKWLEWREGRRGREREREGEGEGEREREGEGEKEGEGEGDGERGREREERERDTKERSETKRGERERDLTKDNQRLLELSRHYSGLTLHCVVSPALHNTTIIFLKHWGDGQDGLPANNVNCVIRSHNYNCSVIPGTS